MSDTDNPTSQSFGIRLDAATLARLDAYAARIDHKRGGAAVRAIGAGLDVLEGVPAAPLPSLGSNPAPNAPTAGLDVEALAVALYERVGPMLADAVAEGAHRARSPKLAPVGVVGVARVVDALRAAYEAARDGGGMADYDARRVLSAAVIEAINVFAYGEDAAAVPAAPVPDAPRVTRLPADALRTVQGERRKETPDRRDPPPREGGNGRRLADALKAARGARGTEGRPLPQRDAAAAAAVPIATYQRAEQGKDVKTATRAALEAWIAG